MTATSDGDVTSEEKVGIFKSPRFRRYFLARSISAFGTPFGLLALTFAVLDTSGSAADLGIVVGASAVPAILLVLAGGVAGDRFERRRILVGTDVTIGTVQLVVGLLYLFGAFDVWVVASLQLVRGAASAFFNPASTGILPTIVKSHEVQAANSLIGMSKNALGVVAPALAGVVIAIWSPGWALIVDAITFYISAVLFASLPTSRGKLAAGGAIVSDLKDGWKAFSSRPWVWMMVASFSLYQASVLPTILVLGPTLALDSGVGAAGWAIVLSVRAVGALAVGGVLLRWRPARPLVASVLLSLLDVPFLLAIGTSLPLWVLALSGVFSSAGLVAADTLWESTLQRGIPEETLSRVSSYDWLGSLAMNPLGNVVVGAGAVAVGAAPVVLTVVVLHLGAQALLLSARAIRNMAESDLQS